MFFFISVMSLTVFLFLFPILNFCYIHAKKNQGRHAQHVEGRQYAGKLNDKECVDSNK